MYYRSIDEIIGNTPTLELRRICAEFGIEGGLFAKLENLNPAGSAKDRVALNIIREAEASGRLVPGSVIIEPTSGNTGIGIAMVGAAKGYRVIIVMPDSMSMERVTLMKAYGAEVVLTPGEEGMSGAVARAEAICSENPGSIIAGQFTNPDNWKAHYITTGPEIAEALDGKVDNFVAGIGTGGSITGAGRFLKESVGEHVRVVGIEPDTSPLLTEGWAGAHGLQGIGANFVPDVLDMNVVDEVMTVSLEDALLMQKLLGTKEGVFVGISAGAACHAAVQLALREENRGKNTVVLLPDSGDRYLADLQKVL